MFAILSIIICSLISFFCIENGVNKKYTILFIVISILIIYVEEEIRRAIRTTREIYKIRKERDKKRNEMERKIKELVEELK